MRTSRARVGGGARSHLLRAAATVAAFLAAWGPSIPSGGVVTLRTLVHDVSSSTGAAEPRMQELLSYTQDLAGDDLVAVVVFGETARVALPPTAVEALPARIPAAPLGPHASVLADALELACALDAPDDVRREIVLVTDGLSTQGADAIADAALSLHAAGVAHVEVRRREARELPARVEELAGPGRAAVGAPIALEVRGVAHAERDTVVELVRGSRVVESRSVVRPGPFRLRFVRIEEQPGRVTYRARLRASTVPAATAVVVVGAGGRPLVIGDSGSAAQLSVALETPCDAWTGPGGDLGDALAGRESIVLGGSSELTAADFHALRSFVDRGGGMLLVGGPSSFALGGWARGPLDALSPLLSEPEDTDGLALYLAIDGSGSMAEPWRGAGADGEAVSRDAVVRGAAEVLLRGAQDDATLFLRRFSGALEGPPTRGWAMDGPGREAAVAVLRAFPVPRGGTALLPVLADAARALDAHDAAQARRVIILSDARTAEPVEQIGAALTRFASGGVQVTLVVPGGADSTAALPAALRRVLDSSGTEVRRAERPDEVARIFREVERRARIDDPVLHDVSVRLSPAAREIGMRGSPPASYAQANRTFLAQSANLVAESPANEPLAAVGHVRRGGVGRGRVAAIATAPGRADWGGSAPDALAAALLRVVRPPPGVPLRVQRVPGGFLVGGDDGDSEAVPAVLQLRADGREVSRAALLPQEAGLWFCAAAGAGEDEADAVRILDSAGTVLADVGLGTLAPVEFRTTAEVDLDALSRTLAVTPAGRRELRPWLCVLAVLLLLAASATDLGARHRA